LRSLTGSDESCEDSLTFVLGEDTGERRVLAELTRSGCARRECFKHAIQRPVE
jgi:hypothetical protein